LYGTTTYVRALKRRLLTGKDVLLQPNTGHYHEIRFEAHDWNLSNAIFRQSGCYACNHQPFRFWSGCAL